MSDVKPGVKPFTWSFSALKNWETCPRRYAAYSVYKSVVEPESDALKQGHDVHKAFELRIKEGKKLPLGLRPHEPMMERLANAPGEIYTELRVGLTRQFTPAAFFADDVWYRGVLDYTVIFPEQRRAGVLDYKTGKPNDDTTQLYLAAVTLLAHDEAVDHVSAKALFLAYNETTCVELGRDRVHRVWANILPRVHALEASYAKDTYPPKPGGLCRRWCAVTSCEFHGR